MHSQIRSWKTQVNSVEERNSDIGSLCFLTFALKASHLCARKLLRCLKNKIWYIWCWLITTLIFELLEFDPDHLVGIHWIGYQQFLPRTEQTLGTFCEHVSSFLPRLLRDLCEEISRTYERIFTTFSITETIDKIRIRDSIRFTRHIALKRTSVRR